MVGLVIWAMVLIYPPSQVNTLGSSEAQANTLTQFSGALDWQQGSEHVCVFGGLSKSCIHIQPCCCFLGEGLWRKVNKPTCLPCITGVWDAEASEHVSRQRKCK